jgi:polyisoprenoid-binding protein YceI
MCRWHSAATLTGMSETVMTTGSVTVPRAGDYRIDPRHSSVTFTTRHLFGLGGVRGGFALREGHVHVAADVTRSTVHTVISAASVDTGNPARDTAVRSTGFLHTERHPDIAFVCDHVERVDGGWVLRGSLKVCGHAQPLDVRVESARTEGGRLVVNATSRVDRFAFGVTAARLMAARHLTVNLAIVAVPAA